MLERVPQVPILVEAAFLDLGKLVISNAGEVGLVPAHRIEATSSEGRRVRVLEVLGCMIIFQDQISRTLFGQALLPER